MVLNLSDARKLVLVTTYKTHCHKPKSNLLRLSCLTLEIKWEMAGDFQKGTSSWP